MSEAWELFERLADGYDEVVPFFTTFGRRLIELLDLQPGSAVLDIGCGRGAIATAAADRGCQVTAIDGSRRMVQLLAAACPTIATRVMDAAHLSFADNSFDAATAGFMIHLVSEPARVLAETHRVIRPGGQLAVTVPGPVGEDDGRWAMFNEIVHDFEQRADPAGLPGRRIDVADVLSEVGFTGVQRAAIEVHLPIADPDTCWQFLMSHGFAGLVAALVPHDGQELRRQAIRELSRMHHRTGIVLDRGATVYRAKVV